MPTFKQVRNRLKVLTMGQLADADIGTLVNQALEEEIESWQWSALFKTGVIWGIPDNVNGVVSLTNGSKTVVGYETNFPMPDSLPDYCPPENWVVMLGSQYMPLNVERFVSPTELELSEPWGDVSQSNVNFDLRPQFYSVPGGAQVYLVRQILPVLPVSRFMLHLLDPARLAGTSTPSVAWAIAGYDNQGNVRLELWLRPGGVQSFVIEYRERFKPLVADNDWPQIPVSVLENKALSLCYLALYASQGSANWMNAAQAADKRYQEERQRAINDDIERQGQKQGQNYRPGYEIIQQIDFEGPPGARIL